MRIVIPNDVCEIWAEAILSGDDVTIVIQGGTRPHVGTAVLAVPRPSLSGQGMSATVSRINCTGHLDDEVAAVVARRVAAVRACVVACTCGIHIDDASPEALAEIASLGEAIAAQVLEAVGRPGT